MAVGTERLTFNLLATWGLHHEKSPFTERCIRDQALFFVKYLLSKSFLQWDWPKCWAAFRRLRIAQLSCSASIRIFYDMLQEGLLLFEGEMPVLEHGQNMECWHSTL
jgi:hypothetical protein